MSKDYERLMLAAKELKGWNGPSAVVVGLAIDGLSVTNQMLGNWKSRGVAKGKLLEACRIIGCDPNWVETGRGNMRTGAAKTEEVTRSQQTKLTPISPKNRHEARIAEIVALLRQTDMEGLAVILDRARDAARDYPAAKETLVSSA